MLRAIYPLPSLPGTEIVMTCENDCLLSLDTRAASHEASERNAFTDKVYREICEYFGGSRTVFDIPYRLIGTPFQEKVWHVLETIPYGQTLTYGEVAGLIGSPKASRAVGGACHNNPIWLIVPCHRVVGAGGALTGYGGGLELKSFLLQLEKENRSK